MDENKFNCLFSTLDHLEFLRKQTRLQTVVKEHWVLVDSIYTLDAGFETMVFPCDAKGKVTDWGELQVKRYDTYEQMKQGHEGIVKTWRYK